MAQSVFYSFHYDNDVKRVQLVRNIDVLSGQPLLEAQDWETVRRQGKVGIEKWIHRQMNYKKAVIVLVGQQTASREWVLYEIRKAWLDKRPLLGVRIHGLSSMGSVDRPGTNPFTAATSSAGVPLFDPTVRDVNGRVDSKATREQLRLNLARWSDQGVVRPR